MSKNRFYVAKSITGAISVVPGYTYDLSTGEQTSQSNTSIVPKHSVDNSNRILIDLSVQCSQVTILMWNGSDVYLGYEVLQSTVSIDYVIPSNVKSVGFILDNTDIESLVNIEEKRAFEVIPHYSQLKKKYKKENGEVFFRESLDGTINLFGTDYLLVKNASIEDKLYFYIYKEDNLYSTSYFNKSDCRFDHCKKMVELKLSYDDKYSKVLSAYENTYDLVKLSPVQTPLMLTKRCVVQIYIQDDKTLSNYAGGTYWETEVDEQINDEDELTRKYHFAKGPKFSEIHLSGFNYDINASYTIVPDSETWNSVSDTIGSGTTPAQCRIRFKKVASAGEPIEGTPPTVFLLSTGSGNGINNTGDSDDPQYSYKYDTYQIEIFQSEVSPQTHVVYYKKIYESVNLYGKDTVFTINSGQGLYPMVGINSLSPAPQPSTFNLGENVIEYQVWGRLLCDVDSVPDGQGGTLDTYDLPRDDFATARRNYRRCIGLIGFDSSNSVVTIHQSNNTSISPTPYGMNDYGEYFLPPYTIYGQYFYPLARSSWANTSLWVMLGNVTGITPFETFCARHYKEYSLRNSYHIGDVIKALLQEIDPTLKHEKTSEFSSFLYGHSGGTASALGNCDIYITQKTNILKGEYDQAAQKAEIKFKQVTEMLRDCFRCYWFIDSENRFRIEHISYFINGFSYSNPISQIDLRYKEDKFNRKSAIYCQQEVEYNKSDLISRYEFAYMDDVTKAMGGDLYVDVNNAYIQKDKTEEINIDGFTADIDYMLFLPDDFSNDGFALLLADSNKRVPIVNQRIRDEKQSNNYIDIYVQNWYASFNQLILHYMEDMPGNNISYNNITYLHVDHIKRSMVHNIKYSDVNEVNLGQLITTDIGNGYIEEVAVNIDSGLIEVELRYEPS